MEKKTEFNYGYEYGKWVNADGAGEPVFVEKMVSRFLDIPMGDYNEMIAAGITAPDSREYWNGYNAYCSEHAAAATLGRKGGQAKTAAKRRASRENGKKGGRPRTK